MFSDGDIGVLNRPLREYAGFTSEEAEQLGLRAAIHPDDVEAAIVRLRAIVASGECGELEVRLKRFDGTYKPFCFLAVPVAGADGRISVWCSAGLAVRAEALATHERHLLEMVAAGRPLPLVLERLCGMLDEALEGSKSSVLVLDPTGARVEKVIGPGLPSGYNAVLEGKAVSCDAGPCGMASSLKVPVLVSDVAVDARWDSSGWPALASMHGLGSCWSTPIISSTGDAVGTLAIYQGPGRLPTPLQDEVIHRLTHIASIAIERMQGDRDRERAEILLAREKRLLEMIARGSSLPLVLNALCDLVEEVATRCHCGILFFGADGSEWQYAVGPNLPQGYNEAMQGRPAHRASGPCGLAAFEKAPVIVPNIEADSRWEAHGWRDIALSHGLQACWSSPILSQDQHALGALAVYRFESGSPSTFELELISQLSHIASIAVERTRSENALKRSEAFLSEAQRLSSTGSFSWHVASNEFTWSEQAHRIFNFDDRIPVTVQQVSSRVHPDDLPRLLEVIDQARCGPGEFEHECRLRMPDQSVKYLRILASGICDVEHGQLEYIGAVQDVTERRLADEALSKVRSELSYVARATSLGALTASIAHEVNQPLAGIVANASTCLRMLAVSPPNIEGARETAKRTIRDGNRAADVIVRLRSLFAKKSGLTELVDLNEATREVIALHSSDLQRSRVIVRTELADDIPLVRGDRVQLQQVILNLMINATESIVQSGSDHGSISIKTQSDENNNIVISVSDTGPGIDSNSIDMIFESFYTTKKNGMGIGLSVCKNIIEMHGGNIWAETELGSGASFYFSVPINTP